MKTQTSQSGQILMIAILFATIIFTIGLSITNLTTKDTKGTKLQEDASRARAAAEAGIEAALGQGSNDSVDIGSLLSGAGLSGQATVTTEATAQFTTPLISKDAQYTFYITGYDSSTQTVTTGSFDDDMAIQRISPASAQYCSSEQKFALELTFIDATASTGGIVGRYVIDECDLIDGTTDEYDFGATIPTSSITPDPHILIARVIAPSGSFDGAKIRIDNSGGNQFPAQGKVVTSTASVGTTVDQNVTKKVKLFQSYPQLPAEFFVTSM